MAENFRLFLLFPFSIIFGMGVLVDSKQVDIFNGNKTDSSFKKISNVWKMAKDFGAHHGVKDWILHNDKSKPLPWNHLWRSNMKDQYNIGYFASHFPHEKHLNDSEHFMGKSGVTLHLYVNPNLESLAHMLDLESSNKLFLKQENRKIGTMNSNIWLVQIMDPTTIYDLSMNIRLDYDTMLFCFVFTKHKSFQIYDAYKIYEGSNVILKKFGKWNKKKRLIVTDSNIWSRRSSLELYNLNVVSIISPPIVSHVQNHCKSKACFKGAFPDIWHALSEAMNFTYTVGKTYDYGGVINGSWNGVIGMIERKQTHIAVADLTITRERSGVVDFLPGLTEIHEGLYLKNPKDAFSVNSYVGSFSKLSWISILIWIVFAALILTGIKWYEQDSTQKSNFDWGHGIRFVTQSVLMIGDMSMKGKLSTQIAFVSVVFGGMVIYNLWDAMLMSFLASRKTYLPFQTIEELLENSHYKLVLSKNAGVYLDRFRHTRDPVRTALWKRDVEPNLHEMPLYQNLADYIVDNPFVAAYHDSLINYNPHFMNCEIISTSAPTHTARVGWAIQKQSPFYDTFFYHIEKMKESGSVDRSIKKYKTQDQFCIDYSGKPVSINQCFIALNVMIAGFASCSLCWILEYFVFSKIKHIKMILRNMGIVHVFKSEELKFVGEMNKHQTQELSELETSKNEDDFLIKENGIFRSSDTLENIEKHKPKKVDLALKFLSSKEVEAKPTNEMEVKCIE